MCQDFLREAIRLSMEKMLTGSGGPFGAVVVRDNRIISRGWNQVTSTNDPTAHAEIVAIRRACSRLGTFSLAGCELFASCEPCPMCLAAIYWAGIRKLYYAATREDAAKAGFDDSYLYDEIALPAEKRSILAANHLRPEALAAFEVWKEKADRIEY